MTLGCAEKGGGGLQGVWWGGGRVCVAARRLCADACKRGWVRAGVCKYSQVHISV